MTASLHICLARPDDAAVLATLAARSFRDAFAADNDPVDMETYIRDAFSYERTLAELSDHANTFLLAFVDGSEEPTGYAKLRPGPADPSVSGPNPVELERIYVDQSAIGHGVGAALMRAALGAAAAGGYQTLWLGVWEHNDRAIVFYQRWGFETVGSHVFRLGSDDQTDLIMVRPVTRAQEAHISSTSS